MQTHICAPHSLFTLPMRKEAGFSLIELMISLTIGLVILGALVGVLSATSSNSTSNDRISNLLTNGRYAMEAMKTEIRQAGFLGYTAPLPAVGTGLGALSNECLQAGATAGSFLGNLRQRVWGSNDSNPFSGNCIPAASYLAGNDVLVVRRADSLPTTAPVANQIYFQSSYEIGQMFRGAVAPAAGSAPAGIFPVLTYVYYISPFTVSASESPLVPALCRVALNTDGSMSRQLVASGIEHMQVQFGRATTLPSIQFFNADALSGSSSDSDLNLTSYQWNEVVSVQIWLLARNATVEPGYNNTQTYTMGGKNFTKADGYRRQLLSMVVQMRNSSN